MRRWLPYLSVLCASAAAGAPVTLVYDGAGTSCPERAVLVSAVRTRLGVDPFEPGAPDAVEVRVASSSAGLTATVVRRRGTQDTGRRELTSPTADCSELFRALELAVAISIDPRAGLVRSTPAPAPPALPAAAPLPAPPPPVPPAEASTPTTFNGGLGLSGALGNGPTPTVGLALLAALRHGRFELELGGRAELPSALAIPPGSITIQALWGELAPCLVLGNLRGCGVAGFGALRVESTGLSRPKEEVVALALLGARLSWDFKLSATVSLRPGAEVAAQLARTTVLVDGQPAWRTAPLSAAVGVAVLLSPGD